jgi:SMODS and SLOG-associating 2TM effector domain family 4
MHIAAADHMFELSLSDHLRLTFGHIVYRQKAHARVAHTRIVAGRILRGLEAAFVLGVVLTSLAAAYGRGPLYVIAAAVLGVFALITLLVHLTFDLDASARAHSLAAARLWQIREQYRAVLSDLHDGAIDPAGARQRRDALTSTLRDFLEHAPSVAPQPYQIDDQKASVDEPALTDAQIDMFLPKSLQKTGRRVAG